VARAPNLGFHCSYSLTNFVRFVVHVAETKVRGIDSQYWCRHMVVGTVTRRGGNLVCKVYNKFSQIDCDPTANKCCSTYTIFLIIAR
jgi:hypothetical protein